MKTLESRKLLLITEIEINRIQLLKEWQTIVEGGQGITSRVKTIESLSTSAVLLVTCFSAFRRRKHFISEMKNSRLNTFLKGLQWFSSIWLVLRAKPSTTLPTETIGKTPSRSQPRW